MPGPRQGRPRLARILPAPPAPAPIRLNRARPAPRWPWDGARGSGLPPRLAPVLSDRAARRAGTRRCRRGLVSACTEHSIPRRLMAGSTLDWGILGTGAIAKAFAKGLAQSQTGRLVAVASRSQASADKFCPQVQVDRRHASYEALLADPAVQAVYISTPHTLHAEWAIRAAEAKKHVLCEKPIGV